MTKHIKNFKELSDGKIAVISDVHIGDPRCSLFSIMNTQNRRGIDEIINAPGEGIFFHSGTRNFYNYPVDRIIMNRLPENHENAFYHVHIDDSEGSQFSSLAEIIKDVDTLIILGDLFDIAVQRNDIAYTLVKEFLAELKKKRTGKKSLQFIYVPGNHDYSLWRSLEWERNVIRNSEAGVPVQYSKHVVPGVLDCSGDTPRLSLYEYHDALMTEADRSDDSEYTALPETSMEYGQSHLNHIFDEEVYIAFPNLYIVGKDKEVTLLTHGQYFEDNWSGTANGMVHNWTDFVQSVNTAMKFNIDPAEFARGELGIELKQFQVESENFNLPQFIQVNSMLCNVQSNVGEETGLPAAMALALRHFATYSKTSNSDRLKPSTDYLTVSRILNDPSLYLQSPEINVPWYLHRTCEEMNKLLGDGYRLTKFIYGHTHVPAVTSRSVTSQKKIDTTLQLPNGNRVSLKDPVEYPANYSVINTGGWIRSLKKENEIQHSDSFQFDGFGDPCGAIIPILKEGAVEEIRSVLQ